jgi:hypothetical protein
MKSLVPLYLLIAASFLLGFISSPFSYGPILFFEYDVVSKVSNSVLFIKNGTDVFTMLGGFTLVISHVFLIISIFLAKKTWFKTFLIVVPLIFILSFIVAALVLIVLQPLSFILIANFLFFWIRCVRYFKKPSVRQ